MVLRPMTASIHLWTLKSTYAQRGDCNEGDSHMRHRVLPVSNRFIEALQLVRKTNFMMAHKLSLDHTLASKQ